MKSYLYIGRSQAGFSLISLMVAIMLSFIMMAAFGSFVKGTSASIVRTNEMGAKEDLRMYLRQRIDCTPLDLNYKGCNHGDVLQVLDTAGGVLIPVYPAPPSTPLLGLPFNMRAICNTDPTAPTRYQIEVIPSRDVLGKLPWTVLFPDLPPCA